ncbi:hypothetical protein [Ralstonia phage phiRSL1]|uniref:Uncharacterized protein n=1 Tax=Ralstonia phage phiRSL1 TaxID=1980924 RepID=B2ZXU6_9CAUD|nr:hypothetical protein RSL1_ORF076 [Ralstonia phage phiRSL1]BAG41522.1 hypothetical protein [Ralstonia phage phiRSL1]
MTKPSKRFGNLSRDEKLQLMADWVDGKVIEVGLEDTADGEYYIAGWSAERHPAWTAHSFYRVRPTLPNIDWAHVSSQFRYMATSPDGQTFLYVNRPILGSNHWTFVFSETHAVSATVANIYSSFKPGTCDWQLSLVERPDGV